MIKDKIKHIKRCRLKKEEIFLLDIFNEMYEVNYNGLPNSVFYKLNDIVIFEKCFSNNTLYANSNKLYVNFTLIWRVLESDYNYEYTEVQDFISLMTRKYLKWNEILLTPFEEEDRPWYLLKDITK